MRDLTLIMPYYRNPTMLEAQQRQWASYHPDLLPRLHVIVVDDGSPKYRAERVWAPPAGLASARLYRIVEDVRWNWIACRNLAASKATTDWMLLTDIDHMLPETTLRRLVDGELDPECVYRLSRVDAPHLTPYKPHPNTWVMTRDLYDRVGGYDERLSGWYGTDAEFRDRVQQRSKAVVMLPDVMIRYPREVISDASTTHYARKTEADRENVRRIRAERAQIKNWTPLRGTFAWEQVR